MCRWTSGLVKGMLDCGGITVNAVLDCGEIIVNAMLDFEGGLVRAE